MTKRPFVPVSSPDRNPWGKSSACHRALQRGPHPSWPGISQVGSLKVLDVTKFQIITNTCQNNKHQGDIEKDSVLAHVTQFLLCIKELKISNNNTRAYAAFVSLASQMKTTFKWPTLIKNLNFGNKAIKISILWCNIYRSKFTDQEVYNSAPDEDWSWMKNL